MFRQILNRFSLKQNFTAFRVIECTQKIHQRRFTGAGTSSEHRKFPGRNPNVNVFQNHQLLATGNRKALNHIFGFYHIFHSDTSLVFTKLQRLGNINLTNQLTKNYHADYNHNTDDAKETNHIKRLKHNCKRYRLVG